MMQLINNGGVVSTHASVRRRQYWETWSKALDRFQLTPP